MRPLTVPAVFLSFLTALCLATPALAAEEGQPPASARAGPPAAWQSAGKWAPDRVIVGLGGGIAPDYSGSNDYEFQPGGIVQGTVSGFAFAMRGTNFYVDLARERRGAELDLIAGPVVQLRFDRKGKIEDPRVAALGERGTAVELGGFAGIGKRGVFSRFDEVSADVTVVKDVSSVHQSTIVRPSIGYQTLIGKRTFALTRVSADFVGKGFARTYYDVPAGSALPAYSTNGGGLESVGITTLASHSLGRDPQKGWSLFALGGYSRITGKFARSPVVAVAGTPDQFRLIGGIGYTF